MKKIKCSKKAKKNFVAENDTTLPMCFDEEKGKELQNEIEKLKQQNEKLQKKIDEYKETDKKFYYKSHKDKDVEEQSDDTVTRYFKHKKSFSTPVKSHSPLKNSILFEASISPIPQEEEDSFHLIQCKDYVSMIASLVKTMNEAHEKLHPRFIEAIEYFMTHLIKK